MLCARRHSGSLVSLVNSPWLAPVVLCRPQTRAELFAEPGVVADLLDKVCARHDDEIPARHADPEDRAPLQAPPDDRLHRVGRVEIEEIPEDRHSVRS